jgi:hypothetical protein
MKPTVPNGRPVKASADEIIAAYRRLKSVPKVCAELHAGTDRVERILNAAGFVRRTRTIYKKDPGMIPENYLIAISDYQRGIPMSVLKETYGVSYAQLYRWMDICSVARREPQKRPKEWRCWECGSEIASGEMFCCQLHRGEYNDAAIRPGFVPPKHHRRETLDAEAQSEAPPPEGRSEPGYRYSAGNLSGSSPAEERQGHTPGS